MRVVAMVSAVVTLYAERSPDWLAAAVIEQRHRLRPRRHDVGLRVGHGTVVTSPPPKRGYYSIRGHTHMHS